MAIFTGQITASADNGYTYPGFFETDYNFIGYDGDYNHSFFRFTNVTIPQGATIISAKLQYRALSSTTRAYLQSSIYFNKATNAVSPTTEALFLGKALTTTFVNWDSPSAWTAGTYYDSPDITSVVQEIVNQSGWASGNAMMCIHKNRRTTTPNGAIKVNTSGTTTGAKLVITYSVTDNRNGSFTITDSNSVSVTGKKAVSVASIPISNSNSVSVTGKKGSKVASIPISHSNSMSGTGTKGGKVTTLSILNSNSTSVIGIKDGVVANIPISNINSIFTTGSKRSKGEVILISDSFNRADSSSMGNSESGQAWETTTKGSHGIIGNTAYPVTFEPTLSQAVTLINTGQTNYTVQMKGSVLDRYSGLIVRGQDANNYFILQVNPSGEDRVYRMFKLSYDTLNTTTGESSRVAVDGDIIKIIANATQLSCYINNEFLFTVTDSIFNSTGKKVGLYSRIRTTPRYDDFKVTLSSFASIHSNTLSVTRKKNVNVSSVALTNSNSISVTGIGISTIEKSGTFAIIDSNSISVSGKKAGKGTLQITGVNSISVNGKKNGKSVSQITNSNSVSAVGKKAGKDQIISIVNTASILVLSKKASRASFGIIDFNSMTAAGRKAGKTLVAISNISTINLLGKKKSMSIFDLGALNLMSSIGKKSSVTIVTIQNTGSVLVYGEKTSENISSGSFSIVNYVSVGVVGRKSSRAPPINLSHTSTLSVISNKLVRKSISIVNSNSVMATGRKTVKASVEINGATSTSTNVRKSAYSVISINNIQEVLITGRHTSKAEGIVTIVNQNAITVIGKKVVKGIFSLTNSNAITVDGKKGGKTPVILSGCNESVTFGMKASFVDIDLVNLSGILITGVRSSAHKPYEVILELIERRMDLVAAELKRVLDIAIAERIATLEVMEEKPLEITLKERIAELEVEEWHS